MRTIRVRESESSTGIMIATALLGAVAGFAVGMYVAQRFGGFGGLMRRLRRHDERDRADAYYEALGKDRIDDEDDAVSDLAGGDAAEEDDAGEEAPDPVLERRVLEAFANDPVLSERGIDIGSVGPGDIELEGWVDDDSEAEHAVTLARGVPGVRSVANRLMVDAG